jgi:LPS-assembly protein
MRFRHLFVMIYLLCTFAHHSVANAELLGPDDDQTLVAAAETTQEVPTVVEADRLEGKKGKQLEASGNALLRKGDQTIRADRLLYFQDTQDIQAQGSVLLLKGDQSIRTDRLWYFHDTREIDAQGSVVLEQKGSKMSGPHLKLNLDTSIGTMEKPVFFLPENNARGAAEVIHIQDKKHFILDKASYTTCPAGNQDWMLNVNELEIDKSRQIGIAHHAWIEFKDVPILYSPWMDFPLNDQRKSGFLAPIFGGTVSGGSELTLPYYWNIAANHDATIAPRLMLKRGLMLNNEFRYLEANYGGEAQVDVLPNDKLVNHSRNRFSLKHRQALARGLNGYINFNRVSDSDFFRDLADTVSATSQVNLLREAELSYQAGDWITAVRVQRFQTLQDPAAPIPVPYARLPQLTINTQQYHSGVNLGFAGEYVDFRHPTAVNGSRAVLNPSVSYPMVRDSSFYVTPKLAFHSTYYVMGENNIGALPNASRSLPILSMDSGVTFERDSNMFGGDYLQTFEPRAYYVYVPYRDQSALPNYDSALADFNFTQIFTENRFSGSDRIGDADQITVAATSRLLDQKSGAERFKVMMGERFSLQAPQVNLVAPATSTSRSDVLLAALGQLTRTWSLDSEFQFDPNQTHMQVFNIAAHHRPEAGKTLNLGYRFTRNTLRQVDVSTQWPMFSRWQGVGRYNYSLQDGRILEVMAGLEYNQSCWSLRLVAQRFATATQQYNIGFFVQLELNNMVKMGSDPLSLLSQSVPGYAKLNGKPATNP